MNTRHLKTAPTNQDVRAVFYKNYCNGGKQNVPNGQAQRAVKMNMPMALVSQASRLDIHGILPRNQTQALRASAPNTLKERRIVMSKKN